MVKVIIGDPYKFAILFDRVKTWNVSLSDNNGFLGLCIDGQLFPDTVINTIMPVSLFELKESLKSVPVNEKIYNLESKNAFKLLYKLVYPSDDDSNDYRYELATSDLTDNDNLVFAVGGKEKVKLVAAKLEYDYEESCHIFDESAVREVILDKNEVDQIIKQIDEFI